jgi:hypothetical protein
MKHLRWVLLICVTAAPSCAATRVTVDQLKDTLVSLHQAQKEDADVASRLMTLELSEQLTHSARNSLAQYAPGPLSSEQLDILEGRSAFLAPPAAGLPTAPAPDAAAQKAILAKAADYVSGTYAKNPRLAASKTTSRFQDFAGNTSSTPGLTVSAPNSLQHLSEAHTDPVLFDNGVEKPAVPKARTNWGQNGQISEGEPGPSPAVVLQEATAAGKLAWLRWETIDGRQIAVFSFAVEKKKTHYDVSYCCFPDTDTQSGIAAAGAFVPANGEIQSVTTWKPFKKVVGYHGELYIDQEKGTIVRTITTADLKPSDFVHTESIRVDYAPVVVDGKELTVPADSFIINEVVPGGDSGSGSYSVRHTLFNITYQNYHSAG